MPTPAARAGAVPEHSPRSEPTEDPLSQQAHAQEELYTRPPRCYNNHLQVVGGRLVQGKNATLTRWRSEVQVLQRPPPSTELWVGLEAFLQRPSPSREWRIGLEAFLQRPPPTAGWKPAPHGVKAGVAEVLSPARPTVCGMTQGRRYPFGVCICSACEIWAGDVTPAISICSAA